ncbi:MAG TPA: site-specific DNA-methyltransferase [Chloroflexota bacterium]|nr:site-specific DNA-methyltransferase [Chloroflexota bacterium]
MRPFINRLNDLSPREWIKFQKSWFIHNPPPRERGVLVHPGKFPETLAREFIEFFTKRGEWVLDPMVGTGSTLLAARAAGRPSIGIELNEAYARLALQRLQAQRHIKPLRGAGGAADTPAAEREQSPALCPAYVIVADARHIAALRLPEIAYCLTSPPYWNMLHRPGFETQAARRRLGLPLTYSASPHDLGNIADYEQFLDELCAIYTAVHAKLRPRGYLTVIVKNVKKGGRVYPLAWDLARRLSQVYALKDERIWLQDNQRLAPYGLGNAWVSNIHHHYCLIFRKE